jgi:hypothetical protein
MTDMKAGFMDRNRAAKGTMTAERLEYNVEV